MYAQWGNDHLHKLTTNTGSQINDIVPIVESKLNGECQKQVNVSNQLLPIYSCEELLCKCGPLTRNTDLGAFVFSGVGGPTPICCTFILILLTDHKSKICVVMGLPLLSESIPVNTM